MVKDSLRTPPSRRCVLVMIVALVAGAADLRLAGAADLPIRLSDAAEQGAFNVGAAQGNVGRLNDPEAGGAVLKLDYTLPQGTAAGVWTKRFPQGLDPAGVDIVRAAVKTADPAAARAIGVTLEIKGTAGIQRMPLEPHDRWDLVEQSVDWKAVGNLNEVVVSVNRVGDGPPAVGSVALDVRFDRIPLIRKLAAHPVARLGAVSLIALAAALVAGLLGTVSSLRAAPVPAQAGPGRATIVTRAGAQGVVRDLVQGAGTVAIVSLAMAIYALGDMARMEAGWAIVSVVVAGGLLGAWWKVGLTGKLPTPLETFLDVFATGALGAASSSVAILQVPASWSDLLILSQPVAATAAFLYLASNAVRLSSGLHLSKQAGVLIVGVPFAFGGLVLLESNDLVRALGNLLALGTLSDHAALAEFVGRVAVLFAFNELATVALTFATRRPPLRAARAHLALLAIAVAAVAGPWIAAVGSLPRVESWPDPLRLTAVVVATVLSQAGLWAEVYLLTGLVLDAIRGREPTADSVLGHSALGMKKGMIFSGIFMAGLSVLFILAGMPVVTRLATSAPLLLSAVFGALVFPLVKTIVETFDGSPSFFWRARDSYHRWILYARGAVVGLGVGYGLSRGIPSSETLTRVLFGLGFGVAAFAVVNLVRDALLARVGYARVQAPRVYLVQAMLGGFIGAAIGFYFDTSQLAQVVGKFHRYVDRGQAVALYDVYPLLSKWGFVRLGNVGGCASLLFAESLAGVLRWSIPAWLFAINRTFMAAYFDEDPAPIKAFFTRAGLVKLVEDMIGVLRWGLWMSPIIESFLRKMGEPTWYNQDGAIHTVVAIVRDATMDPAAFRAWSLNVFIALLAYDWVRVLIWLDHFGLRVATLVNLSFLGMDRLDRRLSRFLAPAATARCVPEGVKRFTTWAPLVIPFYLPMGRDWDYAWGRAETLRGANQGGLIAALASLSPATQVLLVLGGTVVTTAVFSIIRRLRASSPAALHPSWTVNNGDYEVTLRSNGELFSRVKARAYDISRRSYDRLDPAGRALFLVNVAGDAPAQYWPLIGNVPGGLPEGSWLAHDERGLSFGGTHDGLSTAVEVFLPENGEPVEVWSVTIDNPSDSARRVKLVPYLEWVLNAPDADRGHTQYNRLFAELEYVQDLQAVLAWDKHSKAMGILASDVRPEGFLSARVDVIGRARSIRDPRVLETLAFTEARDTEAHPTLDPIASLLLDVAVPARGSARVRLLIGMAGNKREAIDLIGRHLQNAKAATLPDTRRRAVLRPIGHGEIPPGTSGDYYEFSDDGRRFLVRTPFTTRPFDHTMSNRLGHVLCVTNRGLHTSASVNSQQNRLTPDWADTVTREVPAEAIYLYDPSDGEWFSPTYHPINDAGASHEAQFSVDGTAVFRMARGPLETELTMFVPPDEPAGIYRLVIRNRGAGARRLRVAPYFQMVLAPQPEYSGPLKVRIDESRSALFFENPRNTFRTGPAFVAISCRATRLETKRGRFMGDRGDVSRPYLVEHGAPDPTPTGDDRAVAAFLADVEVPAGGEATIIIVLGQADDRARADEVIGKYRDPAASLAALEATRSWWLGLMDTVALRTNRPEFDRYLDWLKYQALAERIWARRGFYQASGAFGFRDQLQDAVNLLWVDPVLARGQILLHSRQQFLEGDVVHWFHLLQDGRTGFSGRTHASDNLLWLCWGVVEYVAATGDLTLLDERTPYLESDIPFLPLPKEKHGMGFDPLRSSREDTVYGHCMRAIDLVLDSRMGVHGLPLMGTGDWNDGLDEIGSQGRGESVWLAFFLYCILDRMIPIIAQRDGQDLAGRYAQRLVALKDAIEATWREDRYLRAYHDDGTEIGVKGSGIWEIDALTAGWAVMSGINPVRGQIVFETALGILEHEKTILLGWPPLREDSKPYLGRSSVYPEGVRENGMYCHGVQWLVGAARLLAEQAAQEGRSDDARRYAETAARLWWKISSIPHAVPGEIETFGGQPNQQAADMVTTFDPGRMIWNGYTGAAGWVFRQAFEGVLGLRLVGGEPVAPAEPGPAGDLALEFVDRDVTRSPFPGPPELRPPGRRVEPEGAANRS